MGSRLGKAPQLCWQDQLAGVGLRMGVSVMRHRYFASRRVPLSVLSCCAPRCSCPAASECIDQTRHPGTGRASLVLQRSPAPAEGAVGTLIKSEVVPDANLVGATMHIVMYKSKGPKKRRPGDRDGRRTQRHAARGRVAGGDMGTRDQRDGRRLRPEPARSVAGPRDQQSHRGRLRGYGQRLPGRGDTRPDALRRRCFGGRGHGHDRARPPTRFRGSR